MTLTLQIGSNGYTRLRADKYFTHGSRTKLGHFDDQVLDNSNVRLQKSRGQASVRLLDERGDC
jgi:hypothetical protein